MVPAMNCILLSAQGMPSSIPVDDFGLVLVDELFRYGGLERLTSVFCSTKPLTKAYLGSSLRPFRQHNSTSAIENKVL